MNRLDAVFARWTRNFAVIAVAAGALCSVAQAQTAGGSSATELRAKFDQLGSALTNNPFKRPLFIDSKESSSQVRGDVYAVMDYPFAKVQQALRDPANWCDVMILHPNTKQCESSKSGRPVLRVSIGKKLEQAVEDAYLLNLAYSSVSSTPEYFQVQLNAKEGPLGTSNYRFVVEAVSLAGNRSFIHLSYSYASSLAGQLATKAYLATAGRSKIGFSATGKDSAGQPRYINGVRGAVERNAMRYYLAIDAYLWSANAPPGRQFEQRLQTFASSLEQYPRQLHEADINTFIAMKQREYERQRLSQKAL